MNAPLTFGSVCSGIEAASVAWYQLGFRAAFFSDIDPFARAVLEHRFPRTPLHGDFTTIRRGEFADIDLLVGGTPCQSFSVAGLRGGMDDDRGNLALEFCRLADRLRPRWIVWENVPGVLSSNRGRDFGSILGALAHLGYGFAYRVLDAQFFGVAQRRRRVFVVGYLGDWRPPAAVLFEPDCGARHPGSRSQARARATSKPDRSVGVPLEDGGGMIAGTLRASNGGVNEMQASANHLIVKTISLGNHAEHPFTGEISLPITPRHGETGMVAIAFSAGNSADAYGVGESIEHTPPLRAGASGTNQVPTFAKGMVVRRLTPVECERLQGFPDGWTAVPYRGKPAADAPRYRALGNSMAVPVMRWIGRRIQIMDGLVNTSEGVA